MTTLLIKITPEVLERAKMCGTPQTTDGTTTSCAVALALQDVFGRVSVSGSFIILLNMDNELIETPLEAAMFIGQFDQLVNTPHLRPLMQPFSFTVELPDEVVERIDISSIMESETLELV